MRRIATRYRMLAAQVLSSVAILTAAACCFAAAAEKPLTYVDILHQLTDLDRLTHLQTGCQGGLFSSWDRNSRTPWGANGDAGQYLRVEPNGEAVMMDIDGPGVIYRIWSANPMGKIRLYLDGAQTPSLRVEFPGPVRRQTPALHQTAGLPARQAQSASDCYLPIPFAKHIKITADKAHGEYYHFNYVLFPKDRPVPSFRLPLSAEEQAALASRGGRVVASRARSETPTARPEDDRQDHHHRAGSDGGAL